MDIVKHPNYWKLKAYYVEYLLNKHQLDVAAQAIEEKMLGILKENNLDPNVNWKFDDKTESIINPSEEEK